MLNKWPSMVLAQFHTIIRAAGGFRWRREDYEISCILRFDSITVGASILSNSCHFPLPYFLLCTSHYPSPCYVPALTVVWHLTTLPTVGHCFSRARLSPLFTFSALICHVAFWLVFFEFVIFLTVFIHVLCICSMFPLLSS